ncbi:hypothetical protein [Roseimaritima sediminicola]|uniref:hypothetical protein n=1 Tax=Roseimaritima sediminicola TaxID=2662066 RepID=UPI001386C5BF|nr:hypothetical protein [Roseimaritima sediminicola]
MGTEHAHREPVGKVVFTTTRPPMLAALNREAMASRTGGDSRMYDGAAADASGVESRSDGSG